MTTVPYSTVDTFHSYLMDDDQFNSGDDPNIQSMFDEVRQMCSAALVAVNLMARGPTALYSVQAFPNTESI